MTTNDNTPQNYAALDAWIDQHFDEEVRFLQALVRVPTDTPPGNNAPHAERTAELLTEFGFTAEKHTVPTADVHAYGAGWYCDGGCRSCNLSRQWGAGQLGDCLIEDRS